MNFKEKYKVCGAKLSVKDDRDYPIEKLIPKAPKLPRYFRTDVGQPVLDQGDVGCCVACSLALCRYIQEAIQNKSTEKFSVSYIYGNRRDTDTQDEGMFPKQAIKTLKDFGVCHWDDLSGYYIYPVSKKKYINDKDNLDEKAYPNRISSYYILKNKIEMMTAVVALGVITIACPVYESLYFPDKSGYVKYVENDKLYGYHEMTLIGYDLDKNVWIVQNSWSDTFADKGVVYIDMNYPIDEAWAMVDEIKQKEITEKYGE